MKSSKSENLALVMFAAVITAFLVLLCIIVINNDSISINSKRELMSAIDVTDYDSETVEDDKAPIGLKQIYTWQLADAIPNDTSLAFYIVHQYAEVYLNDECVYSLYLDGAGKIGDSPASNWVTVPLSHDDAGKNVKIVITPVYNSVSQLVPQFMVGSYYNIYISLVSEDLIKVVLSALCMVIGIVLFLFGMATSFIKKLSTHDLIFLGLFSTLLGMWKLADTRISVFWFKDASFALGYVTIAVLFLFIAVLFYYIDAKSPSTFKLPYKIADILASGVVLAVFIAQICGFTDLRENLVIAHVMIAVLILFELAMTIIYIKNSPNRRIFPALDFLAFNTCGAVTDILIWYSTGSSDNAVFTLISFLLYEAYVFVQKMHKNSKMAYIDTQTGLMNKNRFIEVMNDYAGIKIGIIMLDINSLKSVNDKFGHNIGDIIIYNFSNILRSSVPPNNTICRWGGDEFTIVLLNTDKAAVEKILKKISLEVEKYNESITEDWKISYSAGYALSEDYPKLTNMELLKIADSMMYKDKSKYYLSNATPNK